MADTTIETKTKLPSTEDILSDLKKEYYTKREIPEGWITAAQAAPAMNLGKKAALDKLNKWVKEGKWQSDITLVDGHSTKIFRPVSQ